MEGSYRQSLIHELGSCQEGKYEEEKEKRGRRRREAREFIAGELQLRANKRDLFAVVCRGHVQNSWCLGRTGESGIYASGVGNFQKLQSVKPYPLAKILPIL